MANPPHSRVWASQVSPVTREFVNARINEELRPIRDDIEALRGALLSLRETANFSSGNLLGRLSNMEELLSLSSTRIAQLRALANEESD
tara:strand:+ start:570 stop:836 length:267 start_codon:yes stop_codon:yes gene_type:complete